MLSRFLLVLVVLVSSARGDDWEQGVPIPVDTNDNIHAAIVFDDGTGPAIYVTGEFTHAGMGTASRIARWTPDDGWSALGAGIGFTGRALAVFDDGSGPALYVGGNFDTAGQLTVNYIARWDGQSFVPVGSGMDGPVNALAVFDDGSGPALYAGGSFTQAGGQPALHLARWDGSAWSQVGPGLDQGPSTDPYVVRALHVFDDGQGDALYIGGGFQTTINDQPIDGLASWDGDSLTPVGSGIPNSTLPVVWSMTTFDLGSGPTLAVGGALGTNKLLSWTGTVWSVLGAFNTPAPKALLTLPAADEPGGEQLIVASGPTVYRWTFGTLALLPTAGIVEIRALVTDPFVAESDSLFAAGFDNINNPDNILQWSGTTWNRFSPSWTGSIRSVAWFDDGSGPSLYCGGSFTISGPGLLLEDLARYDETNGWREVPGFAEWNRNGVEQLVVDTQATPPVLYIVSRLHTSLDGNINTSLIQWDGSQITQTRDAPWINASRLVVSGPPGARTLTLAGEDGVYQNDGTDWVNLWPTGFSGPQAIQMYDNGSGPDLFAGGSFSNLPPENADKIARWDGQAWRWVQGGTSGFVWSLNSGDLGDGSCLFVGGSFLLAGPITANNIAQWDGTSWAALGSGIQGSRVTQIAVFDNGVSPSLYIGGIFSIAGSVIANNAARWDGQTWSPIGSGPFNGITDGTIWGLDATEGPDGPELYYVGDFQQFAGKPILNIAKLSAQPPPCPADLTGSNDPNDPSFGVPDGILDANDFFYYLNRFAAGDLGVADLTGSLNPNDPGFGVPDGTLDASDFFFYLDLFAAGCP